MLFLVNLLRELFRLGVMGTFTFFDTVTLWVADGTDILKAANTFNIGLTTSAESLTASSISLYGSIAHELATGNGYTSGGVALTGVTITRSGGTTTVAYTGPTPKWTASGTGIPAWRWMFMYVVGTLNGHVNPMVGFILGDNTPADVPLTTSGNTIDITGSGYGTITHSP